MDEETLLKEFLKKNIDLIEAAAHAFGCTGVEKQARASHEKYTVSYEGEILKNNLSKRETVREIINKLKEIIEIEKIEIREKGETEIFKEDIENIIKENGFKRSIFKLDEEKLDKSRVYDDDNLKFKSKSKEDKNVYCVSNQWGTKDKDGNEQGLDFDELRDCVGKIGIIVSTDD